MSLREDSYPTGVARCRHIKTNGVQCNSPALRNRKLCYFHQKSHQRYVLFYGRGSVLATRFPLLEDANSIQVALMQVMRMLLACRIDERTAGLLLYGLQTASANLRNLNLEPEAETIVIDRRHLRKTTMSHGTSSKGEEFEERDVDSQPPAGKEVNAENCQTLDLNAAADPAYPEEPSQSGGLGVKLGIAALHSQHVTAGTPPMNRLGVGRTRALPGPPRPVSVHSARSAAKIDPWRKTSALVPTSTSRMASGSSGNSPSGTAPRTASS